MQHQPPDKSSGFTLVETALALLVIGLAFLSILGLGRSGMQAVKEAGNETRCEVMAEAVFETLRIYNQRFAEYARTNDLGQSWAYMWSEAVKTPAFFPFPRVEGMSESISLSLEINKGEISSAFDLSSISLNNWNPRYELIVISGHTSSISTTPNMQKVILSIYPDGDTFSSPPRIFTTILNREGGL